MTDMTAHVNAGIQLLVESPGSRCFAPLVLAMRSLLLALPLINRASAHVGEPSRCKAPSRPATGVCGVRGRRYRRRHWCKDFGQALKGATTSQPPWRGSIARSRTVIPESATGDASLSRIVSCRFVRLGRDVRNPRPATRLEGGWDQRPSSGADRWRLWVGGGCKDISETWRVPWRCARRTGGGVSPATPFCLTEVKVSF
jgi:hypothetical protein